ncbi:uncharacterized protein Tco025E_02374 [Trypanosoma conorhini]|uniref:Uncharacterized protein n=1 Tax=Trypanosoma conorhini TaxID=83891 RepID=A0A3S5IU62_9TRYP|nr:uncharacterized protein Tco025E_02374 [Trypanosoma conorhini]RNF24694.1 hypothetical protein Tco025E_02374 [Trypanosoma conorhini]
MARAVNSIVLPYRYPMHRHLPTNRSAVAAAIQEKQVRRQAGCWATAHASPLFPAPTTHASATLRSVRLEAADVMLQQEYFFARQTPTDTLAAGTFFSGYDIVLSIASKKLHEFPFFFRFLPS